MNGILVVDEPNTAPPVEHVWMFISRDRNGNENVCGSVIGELGTQPLMTGNPEILALMKPYAQRIREALKGTGKTIHLLEFTQRTEVEEW
ncbi:MAG: hypothetical protein V4734_07725 [Terriglobus sp.]